MNKLTLKNNKDTLLEVANYLFNKFIVTLNCQPSYIIDGDGGKMGGSKDKNIRRSAMMYYLHIHLKDYVKNDKDACLVIGEVMHRSRTNVLEQVCKFSLNFDRNIEYLHIDGRFIECEYNVGDVVKLHDWSWYRENANLIFPCGNEIKAMVRHDGTRFFTINNDVTGKVEFCGKSVTISEIIYNKGIPQYFTIKEDKKKHNFYLLEIENIIQKI